VVVPDSASMNNSGETGPEQHRRSAHREPAGRGHTGPRVAGRPVGRLVVVLGADDEAAFVRLRLYRQPRGRHPESVAEDPYRRMRRPSLRGDAFSMSSFLR
jgi:hypothetical protein